jgi:hypothetical protein
MFIITGTIQGNTATIKYDNGILSGDNSIINKAKEENIKKHGYLGLAPNCKDNNYLSDELPAHALLTKHVFETVVSQDNDWEPFDPKACY